MTARMNVVPSSSVSKPASRSAADVGDLDARDELHRQHPRSRQLVVDAGTVMSSKRARLSARRLAWYASLR